MELPLSRPRPASFRALGLDDPPSRVEVGGREYCREDVYKHDSWAATALYSDGTRKVVCKFNRVQPIGRGSMLWLGRRLAERERCSLVRLADVETVPNDLGPVRSQGRLCPTAVARTYVPGHPLRKGESVGPLFFPTLARTIRVMHERGMAYVDLHKRENVIVGDDGRPYLIDFQVGFDVTNRRVRVWPGARELFTALCQADWYHFRKHAFRHDPARDGTARRDAAATRPWWIGMHRFAAVPLREARRRLLVGIGVRGGRGKVESERFVEDGLRAEPLRRAA